MNEYDVIVIGGGPGGYAAAMKASQKGLKTALVEMDLLGGTCVHWGCLPTKTLLRYAKQIHLKSVQQSYDFCYENILTDFSAIHKKTMQIVQRQGKRVENVLKSRGIALYAGKAQINSRNEVGIRPSGEKLTGKNIIIATGSSSRKIPGFDFDCDSIMTSKEALKLDEVPSSVIVIGSGASGMEFATIWNRFGAKVTVLEMMPNILPAEDTEITLAAQESFKKAGINIRTGVKVESAVKTPSGVEVTFFDGENREKMIVEKVLVSAGISPSSTGFGIEELGIETNRGFIVVDDHMRTNVPGIYAIGDVVGRLALAVVAASQAEAAIETILGNDSDILIYEHVAHCVYSEIEIASVGLTEKKAVESGYEVIIMQMPLPTCGGAPVLLTEERGFIKLVIDAESKKLLGAHLIGDQAAEFVAAPASIIVAGSIIQETDICFI